MSLLLTQLRQGYRLGHGKVLDAMIHDGVWDAYEDSYMGMTAELVADKYKISRERQDAYACESHRRAIDATKRCRFKGEIVPVSIPQKRDTPLEFAVDESPREDTSPEALAKLKPVFTPDGTVTAGNAPWGQRRCGGTGRYFRRHRAETRQETDGAHRGAGGERHRTALGNDGPGERRAVAAQEGRLETGRRGPR